MRQPPLVTGSYYHICTKSIAGYQIFNDEKEFGRMKEALRFSRSADATGSLSYILRSEAQKAEQAKRSSEKDEWLVRIVAYCLMPTHLHLILQQLRDKGISKYMNRGLNSYTRYFNLRHSRKGPLWERRFERVLIENDEHLLHETRYVHLNPVTAYLTEDPADWSYSSYREYLHREKEGEGLCEFKDIVAMKPALYEKFVLADKENQRERARIKKRGR